MSGSGAFESRINSLCPQLCTEGCASSVMMGSLIFQGFKYLGFPIYAVLVICQASYS
jgi:hypothetical protein